MQFAILLNYTPPKYVEYSSVIWQDSSSWAIALSRIVKRILLSPTPLPLSEHSESNFCVRCNFLCGLGNYSAASLLTRDGGTCAAQPGLIDEPGEPPSTLSIHTTDTWSGRVGEAKYMRREVNNNMRGRRKVQNATATATANANINAMHSCTHLSSSSYPIPTLCLSLSPRRLPSTISVDIDVGVSESGRERW